MTVLRGLDQLTQIRLPRTIAISSRRANQMRDLVAALLASVSAATSRSNTPRRCRAGTRRASWARCDPAARAAGARAAGWPPAGRRLGGIAGLVGVRHQLERHRAPHAGTQLVQRGVDRDAGDPGLEAGLAAVAAEALERLDERRLHQVLEIGRRPGQARDHALDVADVRDEELLEAGGSPARQPATIAGSSAGRCRGHGAARVLHIRDGTARRGIG
jgi:hypothetical protein